MLTFMCWKKTSICISDKSEEDKVVSLCKWESQNIGDSE